MSEKETDILARTIYGEARGESISGMEAVASVVLNRVAFANRRGRFWWGNSIAEVCRAPKQFSCWNQLPADLPGRRYGYCLLHLQKDCRPRGCRIVGR